MLFIGQYLDKGVQDSCIWLQQIYHNINKYTKTKPFVQII